MFYKIKKLEIIVFVAGAVVMILELIGSRIIAPYLGTSIFVWASLIGVILAALSLGYYLGGKFSLKNPDLKFLAVILFLAGLVILFIPIVKEPVLALSVNLGIKFGSVAAALILFTLPSILLGMVSPYAIRLKAESVEKVGGAAGNLYAISTIGSIFGTFLAGFYLIPTFGNVQILFGLSFVLILTSILGGLGRAKLFTLILVIFIFLILNSVPSPYLLDTDSAYSHIRVVEGQDKKSGLPVRVLLLATEIQSGIYRQDPNRLLVTYNQAYRLDSLFKLEIKKALTLGGGAYVTPLDFLKRYPRAEMTVVEIDPKVTQVARDYFNLKDDPRLNIFHQDARIFLNQTTQTYDAIYGDAFANYFSIPFQLTTRQAVEKMSNLLTKDGILVLNVISGLTGEKSAFFQAEYKTLKTVFPQIYVFPLGDFQDRTKTQPQNIIIIASKNPQRLSVEQLQKNASTEQKEFLRYLQTDISVGPEIKILTDDFAPVDYYISKLL